MSENDLISSEQCIRLEGSGRGHIGGGKEEIGEATDPESIPKSPRPIRQEISFPTVDQCNLQHETCCSEVFGCEQTPIDRAHIAAQKHQRIKNYRCKNEGRP